MKIKGFLSFSAVYSRIPSLCVHPVSRMRAAFLADRARWPLWLPVFFGIGIGIYFALPVEPSVLQSLLVATGIPVCCLLFILISRSGARLALIVIMMLLAGFSIAKLRTEMVRAPVLSHPFGPVHIRARVISASPHNRGFRLLLAPEPIRGLGNKTPARIRLSARYVKTPPAPGRFVRLTAKLLPLPTPVLPGGYDFARRAWYQRMGAIGYLYGKPHAIAALRPLSPWQKLSAWLAGLRMQLTDHIRTVVPGPDGAIAAALITGVRGNVPQEMENAYRDAGLTHVLSISGLHLALAGGIFFWLVRALLALFPTIALRWPIKKWAAVAALAGSLCYLAISGADIPAVRSEIMLAVMFIAILMDRPALSMRSVAAAAMLILILMPESLLQPGCLMSFACVIGLIALAEGVKLYRRTHEARLPRPLRYFGGILSASLVATLVSAPIAIFYFDRAAQYGLIANLVAEPVVGFVIMPAASAAMLLMPFGLDVWPLKLMGFGVHIMSRIAVWVAGFPGASALVPVWPLSAFLLVMGGILWIALWSARWRWLGLAPVLTGMLCIGTIRPPDLLIARGMEAVAVRQPSGRLDFLSAPDDSYAAKIWLQRAGDDRDVETAARQSAARCDGDGCRIKVRGKRIAFDKRARALSEDCQRSDILISAVPVKMACPAPLVLDRFRILAEGGAVLWLSQPLRIATVAGSRGARPWRVGS